jgi:hypothetical protein
MITSDKLGIITIGFQKGLYNVKAVSTVGQSTMALYVGYLASALVLCTFLTRTMKPLRCIALGSNVAFITYSAMLQLYPVLILHCILLAVNVWRLWEIMSLGNSVDEAIDDSKLFNALVPFAMYVCIDRLPFTSEGVLSEVSDMYPAC